ncbi:hypothetical protein [Shewanella glacialimarina]|uniref:hypothetical protein n=1 Tax=Shewanella glacialimarina TaxID=2590884 RepID=UPI001CF7FBA8|nr:hypothetical protein [Shewanella glacialimarina]UCX05422.1 hypothetical protein FJ709_13555 [Shewanella glacialimarina]
MTITRADLKIFKPESLGSSDDAGGQRTKLVVKSGELNELFRAISDIDHSQSAVDIVKCYPALDTTGTELLLNGHVFFSQKPTDPLVSMLLAESNEFEDADRMTDMVEILESSVKAGQLVRNRLIGLLAGQDSFPRSYLQSIYQFNGKDYYETIRLSQGQVTVISVEYEGNENALYPRFEHFCEVQETVTGGQGGQVYFKPAIPFNTPNFDVTINGETGCTKLRYVSANDGIKYHGVSELTAAATSEILDVGTTITEMLPKVRTISLSAGNALAGVSDSQGGSVTVDNAGVYVPSRNTLVLPSIPNQNTYIFEIPDLVNSPWFAENNKQAVTYSGSFGQYANIFITGTTVTVIFTGINMTGNNSIAVSYYQASKYQIYASSNTFPVNSILTKDFFAGEVNFDSSSYSNSSVSLGNFSADDIDAIPIIELNQTVIGWINARTGVVTKDVDFRGNFTLTYGCLLAKTAPASGGDVPPGDLSVTFVLTSPEPVLDSFYVTVSTTSETLLSASADANGIITGTGVTGSIVNGAVSLEFTQRVILSTLRYDVTETVTLSPPPELYGLNPLRIKNGGVVACFTAWTNINVQHSQTQVIVSPAADQTLSVRVNARFVDITDANGASLWTLNNTHYSVVKETGVVTLHSNFSGFEAPFLLTDSIGELALVVEVLPNTLVLAAPLSQSYPIGSVVSSVQDLGDLQARVGTVRDMTAWSNNWDQDGTNATASLNVVDYPIEVRNDTAINEDWVLIMTSPTSFRCVGKRLGQIATGDTVNDFAPINPLTLAPYFIIRQSAFGGGWQAGEAIRFRSYASSKPAMLLRTVQSGHTQITEDRAVLSFRGNES